MIGLDDCGLFHDLCNKLFLFANEKRINRIIAKREGAHSLSINRTVADFAQDCLSDFNLSSSRKLREIKVQIIKLYYKEKKLATGDFDEKSLVNIAAEKIQLQLSMNLIESEPMELIDNDQLVSMKLSCREKIIKEQDDEKLIGFLKNENLINLAKKIDDDMNKTLTMQEFARLVVFEYQPAIQAALADENIEAGADTLSKACLALYLLQDNTKLPSVVVQLLEHCINDYRLPYVLAAVVHHHNAIQMCEKEFKKILD